MTDKPLSRGRKLSIEGASLIGSGYFGNVYQTADDTVVKVLKRGGFDEAERELRLSKWAFSKGIPTAISFDVVDVDGRPGMVYESLGRDNLRNRLRDHPEQFESVMDRYAALLRTINAVPIEENQLPSAMEDYRRFLRSAEDLMTPAEYARMTSLLETIPDRHTLLHRDCQVKNVKIKNDELFLIDLDTLSYGDPIFELAGLYCCYRAFPEMKEVDFDDFFDLSTAMLNAILDALLSRYFADLPEKARTENHHKIALLTYMYMVYWVRAESPANPHAADIMYERFRHYLSLVDDLRLTY